MEKLIIQSDSNNIVEVERFVDSVCDIYNINNYSGAVSMSLLQAVKNAIVHGNKNDVSKTVTITADYCKGGISFCVTDQGEGFDFNKYDDELSPKADGKGIYLMKALSDRLSFLDNGRIVRLDFFVIGIDGSLAMERIATLKRFYSPAVVHA